MSSIYPGASEFGGRPGRPGQPSVTRKHTWAQSATLVTGNASQTLTLQTGDLSNFDYAYFTVQFGITGPANGGGFQATANITFLVNGNPVVRQITVAQGAEISGGADAISVSVIDSTPAGWSNAGQQYNVTATIVPGTRAPGPPPVLADSNGTFAPGTGTYNVPAGPGSAGPIAIPQGVGVVGFYAASNIASNPNPVEVRQSMAAGVIGWKTDLPNTLGQIFIPVIPGAVQLFVFDPGGNIGGVFSILWVIEG